MRARRRIVTAAAISLAAHGALVLGLAGGFLSGALPALPIEIDVSTVRVDDLHELPLGLPAVPAAGDPPDDPPAAEVVPTPAGKPDVVRKADVPRPRPRLTPPRRRAVMGSGEPAPPRVKPTSVRSYAPEGSRVVALLRLDRLRGTSYADPVDGVLKLLPDRRDLLEGTELDLYRDVETLLAATPNPLDAFATLLIVRHRLADADLRRALDKGARATGRKLLWRSERGRPFAERRSAVPLAPTPGGEAAPARRRDERLILLVAPGLAVVTPPSYRKLLLGGRTADVDGGAGVGGTAAGGAAGSALAPDENGWASLVDRIDAEDSILPANAVAMLSVAGVFTTSGGNPAQLAVPTAPGTRGVVDDPPRPAAGGLTGLPAPRLLTAVLGIVPQPFAEIDAELDTAGSAARWLDAWPGLRHQLLTNPLVVLTGLAHIVSGVQVERREATIHVHIEASEDETIRIFSFLASQLPRLRH